MKATKLLLLLPLLLAGCNQGGSETPSETLPPVDSSTETSTEAPDTSDQSDLLSARKAVNSLRGVDHMVSVNQKVFVNQADQGSYTTEDIYIEHFYNYQYSYDEEELTAYRKETELHYGTLVEGTHDIVTDANGNPKISISSYPDELYFKDPKNGTVLQETITMSNTIETSIMANYNSNTGMYDPIVFEEEFKNPFDFILPRDLIKLEDAGSKHRFSLSLSKAEFLADCYGANATNKIDSCVITTDSEYQIERMTFVTPREGGYDLGYSYERTSELVVTITGRGDDYHLDHLTPYTNSNTELENAFNAVINANSYRYEKRYLYGEVGSAENPEDNIEDKIAGYMTKERCFFHHKDSPDDVAPYQLGDDYDYIANKEGDVYYGYEYNMVGTDWKWGKISVSVSAYYTLETFNDIGPNLSRISPAIFRLKEGTDNTYVVDDSFLYRVGSFFDFQFLGVNSQVLETNTSEFELTLEEDGSFVVNTGFIYYDNGTKVDQKIQYVLDASTINNTTLPLACTNTFH